MSSEDVRIGVFICHCGKNIGGVVDVNAVVEYAKTLPNVVVSEQNTFTCSAPGQNSIKDAIKEHKLNRVVVAACSPQMHEPTFKKTVQEAGLNPFLFEMANIREHVSWVHPKEPEKATIKAKDIVRMAIAKVRLLEAIEVSKAGVIPRVLVVGGGVAGLQAALDVARKGFDVVLVEKSAVLGGNALKVGYLAHTERRGTDIISSLITEVQANKRIQVYTETKVSNVDGAFGEYHVLIHPSKGDNIEEKFGSIIVATGYEPYRPKDGEFGYKKNNNIKTLFEFDEMCANPEGKFDNVDRIVFIGCVGSMENPDKEGARTHCSRVCCSAAFKNMLRLKEYKPSMRISFIYQDIRTYQRNDERMYEKLSEKGIILIRYHRDQEPFVDIEGKLNVQTYDSLVQEWLKIPADMVVLATGMDAPSDVEETRNLFKLPCGGEGFFKEAHAKLRPVEVPSPGIYLAGACQAPKDIIESITSASAAASKAVIPLIHGEVELEPLTATVNEDICGRCGVCEPICPYGAISYKSATGNGRLVAHVDERLCSGCGTCVAGCPSGALDQKGFKNKQLYAILSALEVPK
ncbi:MAG: CoB--CoM heterodisulfide reductase iron-sulfur subunit A family protein [Candidatus Heimdallarchaeota archaeon]|nr:CoB--CoM heterodisulfide reductase iron-sulfur subunit A family protein [Candidatus Heimdallarchaeota archaeon]